MVSLEQVRNLLESRRNAYSDPEGFREARHQILGRPESEVFAAFGELLSSSDEEDRCQGIQGLAELYGSRAVESILPRTEDPSEIVRWVACGCLHDIGDERAISSLLDRMKCDPDAQVRGTAAYALGGIGAVQALPHLHVASTSDFEVDELGHSPAGQAVEAMSDVLRRWTIRRIAGEPSNAFEETTPAGRLRGRVNCEAIPFDSEGRIHRTPRYKQVPTKALGFGWSSKLGLRTSLVSPFEIDVSFEDATCVVRRIFVFLSIDDASDCDWAVHTIVDAEAAKLPT